MTKDVGHASTADRFISWTMIVCGSMMLCLGLAAVVFNWGKTLAAGSIGLIVLMMFPIGLGIQRLRRIKR